MTDLSDLPPSLSPRLLWCTKYHVQTEPIGDGKVLSTGMRRGSAFTAFGDDPEHAIVELAKAMRVPLWNEDGGEK